MNSSVCFYIMLLCSRGNKNVLLIIMGIGSCWKLLAYFYSTPRLIKNLFSLSSMCWSFIDLHITKGWHSHGGDALLLKCFICTHLNVHWLPKSKMEIRASGQKPWMILVKIITFPCMFPLLGVTLGCEHVSSGWHTTWNQWKFQV